MISCPVSRPEPICHSLAPEGTLDADVSFPTTASDVIISLYNPAGAPRSVLSSGVEIRKGDFTKPETLDTAFSGANKLLLVSYPSIAHEIRVQSHKAAIDAAKRCGIKHIYYTSLPFAGDSTAAVMKAHLDTEAYLKQSGVAYTIIREGIYSESWPLYFGFFDATEKKSDVVIPISDGKIAWVCRDDLGEGTAKIMTAVCSQIQIPRHFVKRNSLSQSIHSRRTMLSY